jgi:redox-sensitive bicupin YhaK (pirin superfamily)
MVLRGEAEIEGERIGPDTVLYLGSARSSREVSCLVGPTQLFLIGGKPFEEEILLWWNFVARSLAEIEAATLDWNSRARRFGEVTRLSNEAG